jgi:SEC-C motif-containing protein
VSCPCGLPSAYADCCGRYHGGDAHLDAPTAEALMRSRYTAYVMKLEPYLLATWHPTTRPVALDLADDGAKWLGLEIKRTSPNLVEFVARFKVGGRAHRLHETSRFACEDGRWFYVDGEVHPK